MKTFKETVINGLQNIGIAIGILALITGGFFLERNLNWTFAYQDMVKTEVNKNAEQLSSQFNSMSNRINYLEKRVSELEKH